MSDLKTFLSMEARKETDMVFHIPTAQYVSMEEAEELAASVDDVLDEYEDNSEVATIDEISEVTDSLEHYVQVLEYGLEHQEYSPQFAAIVHASMAQMSERFGVEMFSVPSLESYDSDTLEDYYRVSLESIRGFIQRVARVVPSVVDRLGNKVIDALKNKTGDVRYNKIVKISDGAIQEANTSSGTTTVKMKGKEKTFSMGGELPSDIVRAVKKDISTTQNFIERVLKPYLASVNKIYGVLGEVRFEGGPKQTSQILGKILDIKIPYDAVNAEMRTGSGFISRTNVDVVDNRPSGDKLSAKFQVIRKNSIRLLSGKTAKPKSSFGDMEFTAQQVKELANLAKVYASIQKQIRSEFKNRLSIQDISKQFVNYHRGPLDDAHLATWEDDKALDYAMTYALRQHEIAIFNLIHVLRIVERKGEAIAKFALSAAKALKSE